MAEDHDLATRDEWTPWRGILHGLWWGSVAASLLAVAANILA
jgi:hypothetical protein